MSESRVFTHFTWVLVTNLLVIDISSCLLTLSTCVAEYLESVGTYVNSSAAVGFVGDRWKCCYFLDSLWRHVILIKVYFVNLTLAMEHCLCKIFARMSVWWYNVMLNVNLISPVFSISYGVIIWSCWSQTAGLFIHNWSATKMSRAWSTCVCVKLNFDKT